MMRSKKQKTNTISAQKISVFDDPQPDQKISVFDDPPRKNVFLLSCMDQRLLDDTVRFMNALNLHNRYDQVALAGGAMGALKLLDPKLPVEDRWQGVLQEHLAAAIDKLERPIKDIFLLDHLDCGAYKKLYPNDKIQEQYEKASLCGMIELHQAELRGLARELEEFISEKRQKALDEKKAVLDSCKADKSDRPKEEEKNCWNYASKNADKKIEAWSKIRISYFVMDLLGNVRQLDVPENESDTLPLKPSATRCSSEGKGSFPT